MANFTTGSGIPIRQVYSPDDIESIQYQTDIGNPGCYPFTRGIHQTGYRGKVWTKRMFAGYGCAEESNARYKYLLDHGETGLSIAFDFPTLNGYDTDDMLAAGEFGNCGVAISSLADMEILFDGIPLDTITTSMTINGPAAVIWAMYLANAQKRGIPLQKLGGTIQNDVLKEYTSQNSYIFPPVPSIRLIVDTMEFGTMHVPRWNTISISGYHIREAGSTAVQELAFTLANGFEYVKAGIARGLNVDDFAPRLSFFFDCHNDFFEEIAKFRAARRIWAREIRQRFHAGERAQWMRFHTQTAGCSLTEQQPENNIIRTTLQALAAVLGGTQSLHTNSMDEVMALPSEKAVRIALRTQQIIEKESGVTRTVDPLGGSYFIEALTDEMEKAAYEYFARIDAAGGVIPCIESGFFLREIADSAYSYQKAIENKQQIIIGVNEHTINEPIEIPIHEKDADGERRHLSRLNKIRLVRDNEVVSTKLAALRIAAGTNQNLMPFLIEAVSAYATLGEICNILRKEFGEYSPLTIY